MWSPDLLFYNELAKKLEEQYTDIQTILTSHRLTTEDYNYNLGKITAIREVADEVKRLHKDIFQR